MRILLAVGAFVAVLTLVAGGGPVSAQTGPGTSTSALPTPPQKSPSASSGTDAMTECMRLWDKGTHMTREQWARTCKRIQTRLDNLKVENLDLKGIGIRKMPGTTPQGRVDSPSRPN